MPVNYGDLIATTIKNYRPTLADNLSSHSVILATLKSLGFIVEESGGTYITTPLLHASNTTVGSYYKYEQLDVSPQEGIDMAEFPWKQSAGTVSMAGIEEFQNEGKSKMIGLLAGKMEQLDISFREEIDTQIVSDGTGNSGKDITGIQAAVEDGAAWSVYGGIDSNTNTFWRNQYTNFTSSYTTFGTANGASVDGLVAMRNMYTSTMRKMEKAPLILTTSAIMNEYEGYAEGDKLRLQGNQKMIDLGFDNLKFKNATMVYSEGVPTGYMWFLNPQYLKFVIGKGRNFKVGKFETPRDQDAKSAKVLFYSQLTCSNRARQGLITNIAV